MLFLQSVSITIPFMSESLSVQNFGPIKKVDVTFGDLTVLIGPQASGKSLFLELFKLINDRTNIIKTLKKYNYILSKTDLKPLLENYFGEGLGEVINEESRIKYSGKDLTPKSQLTAKNSEGGERESVFYIPAQRILSISDGRPKNFMEFDTTSPYVLRIFSETLRVLLQSGLGNPSQVFPMRNRLKSGVRESIDETIFHGGKVTIESSGGQRKMRLNVNGSSLPFMTWSAGQKEFMPLLLAMYCLSGPPTSVINKENYKWVIIEEPEMGLHPQAIEMVILEIIELMKSGYKVIVSTHSTIIPEFAWAFESLKEGRAPLRKALCQLFKVSEDSTVASNFSDLGAKLIKTYYFKPQKEGGVVSQDISTLDVGSDDDALSEWGGLSSFASRASEIVSRYYNERDYEG